MSKDFYISCYKKVVTTFGAPEILNTNQGSQYASIEFIETILTLTRTVTHSDLL